MSKTPMSDARSLAKIAGDPGTANLPMVVERHRKTTNEKVLPKLLKVAGKVPFAEELAAAYFCATDAATPTRVKGVLFAALAYFVMPADMVPDFVIAFGFSDDATVLATALGIVGAHIQERHRTQALSLLGKPKENRPSAEPA